MTVRDTKIRQSATCVINRFYSYLLVLFIATQVSGAAFGQCSKPVFKVQPVNKSGCKDTEIVLQATVSGATRYQWCWSGSGFPNKAVPGGHVWSGSTTNRLTIKGSNDVGGTYWLRATNSCGTTLSNSVTVTISKPPVMASNSGPVCEGEPLKLIGTSLAGGVFEWTGPNGFKSTLKSPVVSDNATPAMAGVYSFKVTLGTCIVISTTTVTINLAPNFRPTSNSPVCKGGKLTLGGAPAGMSRYSWIGPNGFSSTSPAPTVSNNATPLMSGIYRLTVYNKNGCSKQMATRVSVDTNPVITAQPENVTVCEGAKANFSIEAPGATNNYQWYWSKSTLPNQEVPDPAVWAGSKSSKLTINTKAGELSGDYWVKVTNSCGTVVSGKAQLKLLHIDVGATYSGPVCEGDPLQVMASGATGTYLWTGPGGFISTERSPVVSFSATPAMAGVYTLTTTNQQGCSKKAMVTVEVKTNCVEQDMNYVASHQILKDEVLDEGDLDLLPAEAASLTYTYYDGLGRPVQQVNKQATPAMSDMVQPFAYDKFGRESVQYLPYADRKGTGRYRGNAFNENHNSSDQYRFYTNFYDNAGDVPYSTVAYGKSRYEDSPLNRVLEQGAPGEAWQIGGATVKYDYGSNTATDKVLIWADNNSGLPEVSGFYEGGELFKNITTDEENHKTITFADKLGKTVLKRVQAHEDGAQEQWADTYFIYNDFGKLTFVLPPGANDEIAKSATIDDTFLSRWAYCYKYDGRKRMTEKRVPGSDWVYMIYDNRNRLVLTQDGNQRVSNEWIFTKYDRFNRPIATGTYVHPEEATRLQMQNYVNGRVGDEEEWYEVYVGADGLHGYSDQSFPKGLTEMDYLTVTYYDNYSFKNLEGFGPVYDYDATQLDPEIRALDTYTFPATAFTHVKGEVTGSKVKVMDGTDTWISSATYYDDRYRAIQTITDNYNGSIDKYSTLYNFPGWVLATYTHHQKNDTTSYGIKKRYTYDHAGRLMQGFHELVENDESQGEVLLAENKYNELGKLIEKNLHVENNAPHQSVDFRYNIRGWLKRINGAGLHNDGSEPQDFFGIEFYYEETERNVKNTPVYNGNLSATKWSNNLGLGDLEERGYTYTYDPMNRLKSAQHHRRLSKSWGSVSDYGLSGISYDKNGNILSLTRNGIETGAVRVIDQLSYTYEGNQLQNINDVGGWKGFKDGYLGTIEYPDYEYDANGNATQDLNNGITKITYNYLNLPETEIKKGGGYIKHIYDARGVKLAQKTFKANDVLQSEIGFMGEFVYEDGGLKSIQHSEGQLVPDKIDGGWEYHYDIKDHLGNTRLTFTTKPKSLDFTASFESEHATDEEAYYYNLAETRVIFNSADANGDGGNEVTRVNGTQPMGAGTALFVVAGDTLDMEVYGYYEGGSGYSTQSGLSTMIAAVAGGFGGATGAGATEAQQVTYDAFDNALSGIGLIGTFNDNVPAAFLNYILFDEDMVMYKNGFVQISTAANGGHELLALEDILVEREGLAYVWVSNESANSNWVYFDDMNVTIHEGAVIGSEDYYPLGLSYNGFKRYDPGYIGTYENGSLAKKDLGFRQYDQAIGRFHVVDPLAELQLVESPYQYAGNNPVNNVDLLGLNIFRKIWDLLTGQKGDKKVTMNAATGKRQKRFDRHDTRRAKKPKDRTDKDQGSSSSANNENNTASSSESSSGSGNDTASSPDKNNAKDESYTTFEPFSKREQAFEPTLLDRNTNSNLELSHAPRFSPTPVERKGIGQTVLTRDKPTELAQWQREASNADDLEKLRQRLYTNQPYHQALAVERLTLLGREHDPQAGKFKLALKARTEHSGGGSDVSVEPGATVPVKINNGGYTVDYENDGTPGVLSHLAAEYGSDGDGLELKHIDNINITATGSYEEQMIFLKAAKFIKDLLNEAIEQQEIVVPSEIQGYLDANHDIIQDEINRIKNEILTGGDLKDFVGIDQTESDKLTNSMSKFESEPFGLDAEVMIVDEAYFDLIVDDYNLGVRSTDKDVTMVLAKKEDGTYARHLVYRDDLFVLPTEKRHDDGTVVALPHDANVMAEFEARRDDAIQSAIDYNSTQVYSNTYGDVVEIIGEITEENRSVAWTDDDGNERILIISEIYGDGGFLATDGEVGEIFSPANGPEDAPDQLEGTTAGEDEPVLNIFEKAMLVVKASQDLLDEVGIDETHWYEQGGATNTWGIYVPDPGAGAGNAALDELKSIPEMVAFGLSIFDKKTRQQLIESITSIDFETFKDMYDNKKAEYEKSAYYAGTYDAVTLIAAVLTGGKKLFDKVADVFKKTGKLGKIDWATIKGKGFDDVTARRFGEDIAANDELAEALAENADLADGWKKLDELGDDVPDGWKKDPDYLKKLNDVVKNGPLNKHVFEGEVKPVIDPETGLQKVAPDGTKLWNVSGAHSKEALDPNKLRIKGEITPVGDKGYYKAKVEANVEAFTGESYSANGGWKVKSKESTFFPDSWSKDKIQAEMAHALNNKTSLGGNKYRGTMSDGTSLTIYLDEAGNVSSAFPEL